MRRVEASQGLSGPRLVPALTFGAELRRLRQSAGLTQAELAERSSYSGVYLGMLERGERTPTVRTIALLAAALALNPREHALLEQSLGQVRPPISALPVRRSSLPRLIGRARQLDALDRCLGEAGLPVLLLSGEPGIGKTRLLYEAIERAESAGWTVLFGACQRRASADSYAPLLDAVLQYLRARPPSEAAIALEGCAWLVRVLPELTALNVLAPVGTLPPERERRLIFDAVSTFLSNVSGPAGTLLVLDDLQWASADAIDLLEAIVRRGGRLVISYRDTDLRRLDPLAVLAADLTRDGLVERCAVSALKADEAGHLLDAMLGDTTPVVDEERNAILKRTGGVPFFIVSFVQAIATGEHDHLDGNVPWSLGESLRQRLALLSPTARDVLQAAAVIGRQAPSLLLTVVAGKSDDDAMTALDVLCHHRFLEEQGDTYRFTHDVIYDVVDADLGLARRAVLHRRVAEALEQVEGVREVDRLAHHYERSDYPEKALPYIEQAGDRASERSAYSAAASYYRRVIERFESLDRPLDVARAREKAAGVAVAVGAYDDALALLRPVIDAYRVAGDEGETVRAVIASGQAYGRRSTPGQGITLLTEHLARLGAMATPAHLSALQAALAHLLFLNGDYVGQVEAAERAVALARQAGDLPLRAVAESRRGVGLLLLGKLDEALRVLQEAVQLSEEANETESLWRSIGNIGVIYFCRGEFTLLPPYEERALAIARQQGDPLAIARTRSNCGEGAQYRGDWAEARVAFDDALSVVRSIGDSDATIYPLLNLAALNFLEGHNEEAAQLIHDAVRLIEHSGDLQAERWCSGLLAEIDIASGYPERAVERLAAFETFAGTEELNILYTLPTLAWAHLERGNKTAATAVSAKAVERAHAMRHRVVLVDALRVAAMAACSEGRFAEATAALDEGLAHSRAMPFPYAEARLLHVYADVALRSGASDRLNEARDYLQKALALYGTLGARADAARARFDLESLAYRVHLLAAGIALTQGQWARIDAVFPAKPLRGRPRVDSRRICAAIIFVTHTGRGWTSLPSSFGDDATAHRRLQEWRADGSWRRIEIILGGGEDD